MTRILHWTDTKTTLGWSYNVFALFLRTSAQFA